MGHTAIAAGGHTGRISIKIKEREGELKIPLRSEKKRSERNYDVCRAQQQPRRNENINTNCEYIAVVLQKQQ